ncbi:MAG: hypothetical protein QN203_04495 [Armatimonadota bacterium]|nr:hypothetical protein [Armatimonadota bacterium]MDR7533353.1 hypothetical protein [Armatimonadota bacterium]
MTAPIAWPAFELEIPATSPAAAAAPPFGQWLAMARDADARLAGTAVAIGGVALGAWRRQARAEVLALAEAYTRSLGISAPRAGASPAGPADAGPLLATGHQPVLAHPGIWIKVLAMSRLVPAGGVGLHCVVDSDALDVVAAEVPCVADGRLVRARVVLAEAAPDVPAEAMPAPTPAQWRAFLAEIDARIRTVAVPAVLAGWERTLALPPPPTTAGLAGAVTFVRRALEGPRPYLDLPVSRLHRSAAFRRFCWAIVQDARHFAEVHNAALAAYREHYGVRTTAQPFPDLLIQDGVVEAPFWVVRHGRRRPLMVEVATGRLLAEAEPVGLVPQDPDEPAFAALPIRPRALTLTAFVRLGVADLFIHGIGGGRYDRATDAIARAFFGVAPPPYATVTATLWLPFASGAHPADERRRLHRQLLDLQHNPDRFLPAHDGPHRALVEEKWALIRRLERGEARTRRERRQATQRIREINEILRVQVADRVAAVQDALRRLDRLEQDAEATTARTYPFLLFPVEAVDRLVDLLADDGAPAGARR